MGSKAIHRGSGPAFHGGWVYGEHLHARPELDPVPARLWKGSMFSIKIGWVDPCCTSVLCTGYRCMRVQLRIPRGVAGICVGAHSAYFRVRAADFE